MTYVPIIDNPSGEYCTACRETGLSHCAHPNECGGMQPMAPALAEGELVVFHHMLDTPYRVAGIVPGEAGPHRNMIVLEGMAGQFGQHLFRRYGSLLAAALKAAP